MITISPIKLNKVNRITFKSNDNNNSRMGLISLDKNPSNRINFEKDLNITRNSDPVQSNPLKAIGYTFVKAYNMLSTPKRENISTESSYIHLPYMA